MSLSIAVYACINKVGEVDLTSNWCISHLFVDLLRDYVHHNLTMLTDTDIEARFYAPTPDMIGAKKTPRMKPLFGAHSVRETPVLIPNTAVKPHSGDYTATSGKLARCRIIKKLSE